MAKPKTKETKMGYFLTGSDQNPDQMGLIPRTIWWVFHIAKTHGLEVKVSAALIDLELQESFDLLASSLFGTENEDESLPKDPDNHNDNSFIDLNSHSNSHNNHSNNHNSHTNNHHYHNFFEHKALNPQHAALYLDAVMAGQQKNENKNGKVEEKEEGKMDGSMENEKFTIFTIHLYKKSPTTQKTGKTLIHNRLHFFKVDSSASISTPPSGNTFQSEKIHLILKIYYDKQTSSRNIKNETSSLESLEKLCVLIPPSYKHKHLNFSPQKILEINPNNKSNKNRKVMKVRQTSDIECSSSSEQSADTVICVVKRNGRGDGRRCNGRETYNKCNGNSERFGDNLNKCCPTSNDLLLANKDGSLEGRKRPQGKEEAHEERSVEGGSKKVPTLPDVLKTDGLEQWVDGPIKIGLQVEKEECLQGIPRELKEHRTTGISSPRVKKLYSALRHKHHKKHIVSELKSSGHVNCDRGDQMITASPDISAFHTFYTKYKQDLLQQNCNFSAATVHLAEIFMPEKCCCKCHSEADKKEECIRESQKSNKGASPHKERHQKTKKHEKTKDDPSEDKGMRTADWVTSVQESNFSKFSQLLHSRKQLIRSIQATNCSNDLRPMLAQYFQNASPLATFDTPVHNHPSPPPEYYSCVEYSKRIPSSNPIPPNDLPQNHFDLNSSRIPYSITTPDVLNEATSARKDGPDGASCHNLFLELQQISNCIDQLSFHDSLQRPVRKKEITRNQLNEGMKNTRNYSSTETIYVPRKEDAKQDSVTCSNHSRRPSPLRNSPRKDRCSIAMALLSCAARYRSKQSDDDECSHHKSKKSSKHNSNFCVKQPAREAPGEPCADDKPHLHGSRKACKPHRSHKTLVSHSLDRGNIYVTSINTSPARKTKNIHL